MAQFKRYSSVDAGGPGPIIGAAGSLITLLRACLVSGYGAFAPAGWGEPIAAAGNIAAFRPGAGTRFHLLVNDNGPNVTSTFKEAWVTGWETLAGIAAPVGSGAGQFPTPAQLLTTGHGVCRKSNTADGVGRDWVLYADDRTMYLFILSADVADYYTMLFFGDIYSFSTVADPYSCVLCCRTVENSATNNIEGFGTGLQTVTSAALPGMYLARAWGGAPGSLSCGFQGDYGKGGFLSMRGTVQYPNGPDNSMYLSPLWVIERGSGTLRGMFRGLYQVCHAATSFTDGQVFYGANEFNGKSFEIRKHLLSRSSNEPVFIAVETSPTLLVN